MIARDTPNNIFDYFEELEAESVSPAPWAARTPRRPQPDHDLKLMPRLRDWERDERSLRTLAEVEGQPWVASLERREGEVRVTLDDGWIETTGSDLEAGGNASGKLSDLAAGCRYSVQFWDANATKALHVGHLRNLALGNALAAALSQAGARVERRSLISDAGRSMGEAMAGIVRSGSRAQAWPDNDQKSDHFVGLCYADYVANGGFVAQEEDEQGDDSLTRELQVQGDDADRLLKDVLAGAPEALELWFKTRAWVIAGQRKTLGRLGVAFDRVFFESDFLGDATRLVERGLQAGHLRRREDGVVVYVSGLEDLEEMPLVRADGLPTQHMRAISYWMSAPEMEHVQTLQICGTEWVSHAACIRQLMTLMTPPGNGGVHPTQDIFHGMVGGQKRAVMSSSEGGLLIDDLIDWLEERLDGDPDLTGTLRAHPNPERVPAQIVLGYFLPYPMTPRVEFDSGRLLQDGESAGWELVRARARHGRGEASAGRPAAEPDYRFAVVQSELYRRHLRLVVERLDVRPLAHYLKHLALWYTEQERSGHVERVVHTLLDRGARGLGLEPGR